MSDDAHPKRASPVPPDGAPARRMVIPELRALQDARYVLARGCSDRSEAFALGPCGPAMATCDVTRLAQPRCAGADPVMVRVRPVERVPERKDHPDQVLLRERQRGARVEIVTRRRGR